MVAAVASGSATVSGASAVATGLSPVDKAEGTPLDVADGMAAAEEATCAVIGGAGATASDDEAAEAVEVAEVAAGAAALGCFGAGVIAAVPALTGAFRAGRGTFAAEGRTNLISNPPLPAGATEGFGSADASLGFAGTVGSAAAAGAEIAG